MAGRWTPPEPLFVDPASSMDPALQILEGLEKHISEIPADEPPAPRTPMLGARLCYRNALHLYKAGADLVGEGELGAGRSLTILALEEFGKAWIYSMLDVGVFTTEVGMRGTKPYIDSRVFKCHRCKQGLVYAVEIGWAAMDLLGLFPTETELGGPGASMEDATRHLANHLAKTAGTPPDRETLQAKFGAAPIVVARLTQLFADRKTLEDTKREGLYVDYESSPPTTPQKVSLVTYERVRSFVASRLVMFSRYFLMEFPDEDWAKIKAAFDRATFPVIELVCPRDPDAEHPTNARPKSVARGDEVPAQAGQD